MFFKRKNLHTDLQLQDNTGDVNTQNANTELSEVSPSPVRKVSPVFRKDDDDVELSEDKLREMERARRQLEAELSVKHHYHQRLLETVDLTLLSSLEPERAKKDLNDAVLHLMMEDSTHALSAEGRKRVVQQIEDEVFGLGPLEPLLHDHTVSDILVNGPKSVYVERHGKLERTPYTFLDDRHLRNIIDRIVSQVGRRIDEASPMVDARLADGSRVNAIIPPLALDGPSVSIRRFAVDKRWIQHIKNGIFRQYLMNGGGGVQVKRLLFAQSQQPRNVVHIAIGQQNRTQRQFPQSGWMQVRAIRQLLPDIRGGVEQRPFTAIRRKGDGGLRLRWDLSGSRQIAVLASAIPLGQSAPGCGSENARAELHHVLPRATDQNRTPSSCSGPYMLISMPHSISRMTGLFQAMNLSSSWILVTRLNRVSLAKEGAGWLFLSSKKR